MGYNSSSGIGFCGLLTIVFITLKLTKYIDWSWWWIFSPIWIGILISIVLVLIAITLGFISGWIKLKKAKRGNRK